MPIKGLSDTGARFPRLGIICKGEKTEKGAPKDLDYFRLRNCDEDVARQFIDAFGEKPKEIDVLFPYSEVEQNFECWMEEWKSSALMRRCDGEQQILRCVDGKYTQERIPCLRQCECKQSAKLRVMIRAIKRLGYFEIVTTSKWDIIELSQNLEAVYRTIGTLQGVPFWLKRIERNISTPRDGKRVRAKKWLLSVELQPRSQQLLLKAQEHQAARLMGFATPRLITPVEEDFRATSEWNALSGQLDGASTIEEVGAWLTASRSAVAADEEPYLMQAANERMKAIATIDATPATASDPSKRYWEAFLGLMQRATTLAMCRQGYDWLIERAPELGILAQPEYRKACAQFNAIDVAVEDEEDIHF